MEGESAVTSTRMDKKKRFPRPSSFIKRRSSIKLRLSIKPNKSKESLDRIDLGNAESTHVSEDSDGNFEQCKRLKNELETSNDKVGQFEAEVDILRSQLRSVYRKELKTNENVLSDSEIDYDLFTNGDTTNNDNIVQNIGPKAYSDGEQDPTEHHTRPCKECEKLLLTRVSALVEAITLRKYVLQMSKINEQGGNGAEAFLSENERKLTKALAEKELLARQFKSVCRERDKILLERDRALEEWEKAASKWETTLDQLDTLMIQQNEAKERDNKTIARFRSVICELESTVKEKEQANIDLQQRCIQMESQLSASKKEAKDCINEHDVVLKANFNIAQELRRVNTELKDAQLKCSELEAAIQKAQTLLERSKATNEHIVKQWKYAVKEKKKLQRDISSIVMSRDEAIQRNLSTLSQLDRVKDERDKLARRVSTVDQNGNYSDDTQCNLAECQFCTDTSTSPHGTMVRYDQVNVSVSKNDLSDFELYLAPAIISGHNTVMVTKVDDRLMKQYNIRKYDDIVSVNQESVVGTDVEKVRKLLEEAETDLNLTLRRYKTPCEITFATEVPIPKRSKLGCGVQWGVYIKDLSSGLARECGSVETGDYINTINGKNLSKILSSALDKYSKRGEKMCMEVTRKLSPSVWKCPCHYNVLRKSKVTLREKYPNRDSVISIESNHSFAGSSISSIPSYISSIDSASICSPNTASESEGYSKTDRRFPDSYAMETGVPPTIAEESSTDDSVFHSSRRRVRSMTYLAKPKHAKKQDSLTRAQSLAHSLNSDNSSVRPRSTSRSSGTICSNGSIVSVKQARPVSAAIQAVTFTVPVSKERSRVVRLDKRSEECLGMKINGGNCVGIYVTGFSKQSLAEEAGVRIGDRLLQLNSYSVSQVTLDYATRILRMLKNCNYIRMEVQNYTNVDDVLKEGILDSLYVRARVSHTAKSSTELSYSIGDKLRVTNTRANYDPLNETWQWHAVRERPDEDGTKKEGLIIAMNYSPELDEHSSPSKNVSTRRESEGDDASSVFSDDSLRNNNRRTRRNSSESLAKLRRYRTSKWRSSIESLGSETDSQTDYKPSSFYEILQEKQV